MRKLSAADGARVALAGIRIANGAAGLFAPQVLARRLDAAEAAEPMGYPFRMFGIRTILLGVDLLSRDPAVRRHALRLSVLIHGSDTVSAVVVARRGGLSPRGARAAITISAVNTALALVASRKLAPPAR